MRRIHTVCVLTSGLALMQLFTPTWSLAGEYEAGIRRWRQDRERRLKADDGWLTVSGLFWLKEGANRIGADPAGDIVLPTGSAPDHVGVVEYHEGKVTIRTARGVPVTVEGRPVSTMVLRDDQDEVTDILNVNDLTFYVIARDTRHGIRVRDPHSKFREEFTGLAWYPVKEASRVTARFVAYESPKEIAVPTILGTVESSLCPGYVVWRQDGREVHLMPVVSEPGDDFFFIFKDETSGEETYPAGRFLYANPPVDGKVILDFNKAYNPPCAFTPYATCPLPPKENALDVRIEAGELTYGAH